MELLIAALVGLVLGLTIGSKFFPDRTPSVSPMTEKFMKLNREVWKR